MKNITVSVDDDLYHQARVRAAEKRSTVSAMVREFLRRMVAEEPGFARLQREQNEMIAHIRATHTGFSAGERLARDEMHDRQTHAVR